VSALPRLLVSSVVRGSNQGDSHGGLYLVDMAGGAFEQVLDWNTSDIDFDGRGADRGLRGIAIVGDEIFIAASDELFVFDKGFRIVASYRNAYLKHCHEICEHAGRLYLTSTGFDSILRLDLATRQFDQGFRLSGAGGGVFDPRASRGPNPSHLFHLNSVHADATGIYVSGRRLRALLRLAPGPLAVVAKLPFGTHNAQPFRSGVIFNDTESDCVVWRSPVGQVVVPVPRYAETDLTGGGIDVSGLARQAFGRGLCVLSDTLVATGSSPTTISLCDLSSGKLIKSVNLTMDVRNAAHGLAVWSFD